MVLHDTHHDISALRKLGLAAAYAVAMVAGTVLLMAAFSGQDDGRMVGADGQPVTAADVVMQSATERALVSPTAAVLAGNSLIERRGF
jgi:hypothetical protein